MHDVRSQLKTLLVPQLQQAGFRGSFPHFRRRRDDRNELISVQFDKCGTGRFFIELAVAPAGTFKTYWGKEIPENKLTAHDLAERLRLGAVPGQDHWFSLEGDPMSTVNGIAELLATQGNEYFEAGA